MTPVHMLAGLIAAHAVADFPLQGDFLSRAKNRHEPLAGVPWYTAMAAHTVIQGAAVALVTGSLALGLCEVAAHWMIDELKCAKVIGFNADQLAHIACKIVWCLLAVYVITPTSLGF